MSQQKRFQAAENNQPRLWNKREVARYYGVSVSTVDQWVCRGKGGPRFFKVGALVRFRPEDVQAYLEQCHTGGGHVAA